MGPGWQVCSGEWPSCSESVGKHHDFLGTLLSAEDATWERGRPVNGSYTLSEVPMAAVVAGG